MGREEEGAAPPRDGLRGVLPVGTVSADGSAVVGGDGNLFLIGGSNEILEQFAAVSQREGAADAAGWTALFRNRAQRLAEIDARWTAGSPPRHLQVIIPDKITILERHFPRKVETPMPLLREIEERLYSEIHYLSLIDRLRAASQVVRVFRQVDTHFTACGAFLVFRAILERLGLALPSEPSFDVVHPLNGDLDKCFFGSAL